MKQILYSFIVVLLVCTIVLCQSGQCIKVKQIRNATILIEYAGKRILVDPMLAEKDAYPGFEGTVNSHIRNPSVDLPIPVSEILNVDAVIVTHTHLDHWDDAAKSLIPKDMLIFVQHNKDADEIKSAGFTNVNILTEDTKFHDITLIKTAGQHGSDEAMQVAGDIIGQVCGIVMKHPEEKTLYIAGDTILNQNVTDVLEKHSPEVIVLNTGNAQVIGLGSIIMGKEDVYQVYQAAPQTQIIATHMDAINHCVLSRNELREFISQQGMDTQRVLVPEDGEVISISHIQMVIPPSV